VTIKRSKGEFECRCDEEGCSNVTHGGIISDFREMVDMIKVEGWQVTKDSKDEWVHYCPQHRTDRSG
jgi:hypothetical protein